MKRSPIQRHIPLRRVPFQPKPHGSKPARPRRPKAPPRTIPRSRDYLAFIRTLPCLVCGGRNGKSEAAHTGPHPMGMKGSDLDAVPLCAWDHHLGPQSYHQIGEKRFFEKCGIDLAEVIRQLQARFDRERKPKMKRIQLVTVALAFLIGIGIVIGSLEAEHRCNTILEPDLYTGESCPSELIRLGATPVGYPWIWRFRSACRIDMRTEGVIRQSSTAEVIDRISHHEVWLSDRPVEIVEAELERLFPAIVWAKDVRLGAAQ